VVARVAAGRSLTAELERAAEEIGEGARAARADLCYNVLRRYGRVQAIVRALARRGPPDEIVQALLWCAIGALDSGRYAEYTVVDQAVRACGLLGRLRAKGFVNALLRAWLRQRAVLEPRLAANLEARFQHPAWWVARVRTSYAEDWERVLAAGNEHPPMTLRVNERRVSAARYGDRLRAQGISARSLGGAALRLERPVPIAKLPGFAQGEVSVQDAGAQRAAPLLDLAAGQRVLDACAAPGGKSAHILELADVSLTALDSDAARAGAVERNLARLGFRARVLAADCCAPPLWWDGVPFDRILADVPCTASGVARRHPDIKWLRRDSDVAAFAARQASILDALWRLLAPGGKLLYVTCSVFPEENESGIAAFLARTPSARRRVLPGDAPAQLLPGPGHDGFYFALIEKPS
jgi:16S rRNA (cytosine967-C5)-methyltransferase